MLSLCEGTLWATEALHVGAGVSSCCLRLISSVVGQTLLRRSVGSFSLSIKVKCETHKHTHTHPQSVSRCSTTERIRRAFKAIACAEEQPWAMIKNTEMLFRHSETHWALFGGGKCSESNNECYKLRPNLWSQLGTLERTTASALSLKSL